MYYNRVSLALALSLGLILGIAGGMTLLAFTHINKTIGGSSRLANAQPANIMDSFSARGSISSLIYQTHVNNTSDIVAAKKFILSGEWLIQANKGQITVFVFKFSQVLDDGMRWHTHEFFNFTANKNTRVHLTSDNSATLSGTVDIKLNNTVVWKNIKSTITIFKGNTIIIVLDDKSIGDHFRGQPIYGTIAEIKRGY
ncbi:MAG: hypothetical protein WCF03_03455 [Nitrososphaeraceae archaeon]